MSEFLPVSASNDDQLGNQDDQPGLNAGGEGANASSMQRLLTEALRVSVCRAPRWDGMPASPGLIAGLMFLYLLTHIALQRVMIIGPAQFYWQVFASGWFYFAALAWVCYRLRPVRLDGQQAHSRQISTSIAPDASHLFTLALAQDLVLNVVLMSVSALLVRAGWYDLSGFSLRMRWLVYLAPSALALFIQLLFLWRAGDRRKPGMLVVVVVMLTALGLDAGTRSMNFWYPRQPAKSNEDAADKSPEITQEVFEQQAALLARKLAEIQPQRPGTVDLYSLTFAPYGEENVFLNETSMVSQVMAQRFDAQGRSLQLANNPGTMTSLPWATPLNLQRAIAHIATRMDVNEDILFMHLSSHGASDGELSAGMWPLTIKPVTPADLKQWLDDAGVKYRVISISACYAGNWVAPLSDANTLVMTASDADHTSYGCGSKSDLTFFGRAMYDEQLRKQTLSFEAAHAAARPIIKQREEVAGKSDGYSNPQIAVGEQIRARLKLLEQRLQAQKPAKAGDVAALKTGPS
ncbi:C13 family peptidase [Undibacterium sp. Ji49W]|uniref:C13 family peptidase n=1 Tax=Undibacterium sp. Ji49W TaxID=3413040 RepID=UPI003BF39FC9